MIELFAWAEHVPKEVGWAILGLFIAYVVYRGFFRNQYWRAALKGVAIGIGILVIYGGSLIIISRGY